MAKSQQRTRREPKPKLTDPERHKRFVEMAREVGASDDPKAFDKAFKRVAPKRSKQPR
jgi:hypothetical protein